MGHHDLVLSCWPLMLIMTWEPQNAVLASKVLANCLGKIQNCSMNVLHLCISDLNFCLRASLMPSCSCLHPITSMFIWGCHTNHRAALITLNHFSFTQNNFDVIIWLYQKQTLSQSCRYLVQYMKIFSYTVYAAHFDTVKWTMEISLKFLL